MTQFLSTRQKIITETSKPTSIDVVFCSSIDKKPLHLLNKATRHKGVAKMFPSISNDAFYQKSKQTPLTIIDVRESDEFTEGHIPQAINRPLSILVEEIDSFEKDKTYYIVCQSGGRSSQACSYLSSQGIRVVNVLGGISEWQGEVIR